MGKGHLIIGVGSSFVLLKQGQYYTALFWFSSNTHCDKVSNLASYNLPRRSHLIRGRPEMTSSFGGKGGQPKDDERLSGGGGSPKMIILVKKR